MLGLLHHVRAFVISGAPCVSRGTALSKGVGLGLMSPAPMRQREFMFMCFSDILYRSKYNCLRHIQFSITSRTDCLKYSIEKCSDHLIHGTGKAHHSRCCPDSVLRLARFEPPPTGLSHTRVNCVVDEYQENPEGLEEGDMVKVIAKGLKFYHIRAYKVIRCRCYGYGTSCL